MAEYAGLTMWTDAYLADTTHLTTLQHGAFLLLLFAMWRSRDCRLPDDDKLLARITGLSAHRWRANRPVLERLNQISDGFWTNKRLLSQRKFLHQLRENNSRAGKASALKRKGQVATDVERALNERATSETKRERETESIGKTQSLSLSKHPLKNRPHELTPDERAAEMASRRALGIRSQGDPDV